MPTFWVHIWRLLRPPMLGEPALWQCRNCDLLSKHPNDNPLGLYKKPSEQDWSPIRPQGCTAGEKA